MSHKVLSTKITEDMYEDVCMLAKAKGCAINTYIKDEMVKLIQQDPVVSLASDYRKELRKIKTSGLPKEEISRLKRQIIDDYVKNKGLSADIAEEVFFWVYPREK